MSIRSTSLLAVSMLLTSMASRASAQVAQGSTFDLAVEAEADTGTVGFASDSFSDSQGATLNAYSHSLSVTDLNALGGGPLTVTTSAIASWVNAGQGSVSIFDTGWNFATTAASHALINTALTGFDVWTYTFLATADGTFDMAYDVVGSGAMFGLQGAIIHWSGPGGDLNLTDAFDPAANGVFTRALVSGQSYTVGIGTYSNIFAQGGLNQVGSFDGQFDWRITSVPEPFSMAGLLVGVSVFFRKRKKA
jgi:hypothetical protein